MIVYPKKPKNQDKYDYKIFYSTGEVVDFYLKNNKDRMLYDKIKKEKTYGKKIF